MPPIDRRRFLKGAALAGSAAALGGALTSVSRTGAAAQHVHAAATSAHGAAMAVGTTRTDDFDPYAFLRTFDWGVESTLPDGRTLRTYTIVAEDKAIEIVPGVEFPAWTLNGQVPGPTLRAREGDRIRVRFINHGSHPHTLHFHGIHDAIHDGAPGIGPGEIQPGGEWTYEFDAEPYGVHLYHCHALPLKRHIHKGLYGAYIVDPKEGWGDDADEMVFVMNGFDTNFDDENDVYAVNTKAFCYAHQPIQIKKGRLVRAFVVNVTEFDPLNSFHIHGNFFRYWEIGHKLDRPYAPANPSRFTDTASFIQGERGLLEFRYDKTGRFMFHAHQSEFVELGWMSFFEVSE